MVVLYIVYLLDLNEELVKLLMERDDLRTAIQLC
jgi:hypothetical protein